MISDSTIITGEIILTNFGDNGQNTFHQIQEMGFDELNFKNPFITGDTSKLLVRISEYNDEMKTAVTIIELPFDVFKEKYFDKREVIVWAKHERFDIVLGIAGKAGEFVALADNDKINFDKSVPSKSKLNYTDIKDFRIEVYYDTIQIAEPFH